MFLMFFIISRFFSLFSPSSQPFFIYLYFYELLPIAGVLYCFLHAGSHLFCPIYCNCYNFLQNKIVSFFFLFLWPWILRLLFCLLSPRPPAPPCPHTFGVVTVCGGVEVGAFMHGAPFECPTATHVHARRMRRRRRRREKVYLFLPFFCLNIYIFFFFRFNASDEDFRIFIYLFIILFSFSHSLFIYLFFLRLVRVIVREMRHIPFSPPPPTRPSRGGRGKYRCVCVCFKCIHVYGCLSTSFSSLWVHAARPSTSAHRTCNQQKLLEGTEAVIHRGVMQGKKFPVCVRVSLWLACEGVVGYGAGRRISFFFFVIYLFISIYRSFWCGMHLLQNFFFFFC
ncbi:hypothetical protein TCSYLVIO_001628 [Trypanosoma cruzi]|nr:hypothetical protein TCSYLVIO_001628 [Trypanosoma cruzi]